MKKIIILLFATLLFGCIKYKNGKTFDEDVKIESLGEPIKIEYYQRMRTQNSNELEKNPAFQITEKAKISGAMSEIKTAKDAGLWKGIWDKVIITYPDTILQLSVSEKKIGYYDHLYYLKENNFIERHLKQQE
ncbi:hypothetical protein [Bernardetia sp.]|uniref:hypothetical protein n=1 Tax=Bernardetia sp. TaxID=1937974 RepID=UPI0025BA7E2D|nr:hypothetical protein [Bernardetia sp.]